MSSEQTSAAVAIRTTQRAPRSCISCSSRKVKCDKSIPCGSCVRRGQSDMCMRELVMVRGEITTYKDAPQLPTYEQLRRENEQLRHSLQTIKVQNARSQSPSAPEPLNTPVTSLYQFQQKRLLNQDIDELERKLWNNLSNNPPAGRLVVSSWSDLVLPSQICSEHLINYDERWNSWVHYALEYPRFWGECDSFMAAMSSGARLEQWDASWMAVYFSVLSAALLMMNDEEAENLTLHESLDHRFLSRMWYSAAIFCLHRSSFMEVPSLRSVQAIAILGICFNNFGDSDLGQHMRSCAIRIAQKIGLDTPYSEYAAKYLTKEAQHRLWWTLVICEWLGNPCHPVAFDEIDFNVPFPKTDLSHEMTEHGSNQEHPVHYHIFMAKTACAFHRFRQAVRSAVTLEDTIYAVRTADDRLARVIDTLPAHLQPDMANGSEQERLDYIEQTKPWVIWQRFDVTLVLLHLRIHVHRILQDQWVQDRDGNEFDWAKNISIMSAKSIIWINDNWNQPASMRNQWALSYHIFTSANLLVCECQIMKDAYDGEYNEVIQAALGFLDRVRSRNQLAYHAFWVLQHQVDKLGIV
ncbi:hypothetical protein OPT61_g3983 [Boeremia exigua]|uniref:Uncharacterized protein n=1 Tax=Boeremia exigua TaxID=749465 RepID=A0ACC2IFQ8_9PLEO|nr:hypothetical protein OPT61_g3983 [Boeremia exigua]